MSIVSDYNAGNDWLFSSFHVKEDEVRDWMSRRVWGKVLEVGCGTGKSTAALYPYCKKLIATDVVPEFVEETKRVMDGKPNCEFRICDVHHLPFESYSFDCVFHFGAFNTFKFPERALSEMDRVVRRPSHVFIGDEGLAPWLRNTEYGRTLIKANPLYLNRPPLELLYPWCKDVTLSWIIGEAFWFLEYRKGIQNFLDLYLPIPGARGGTLRSRFNA